MTEIYFFTKEESIQNNQIESMAFGPQNDESGYERYQLENKFLVLEEAPVYSLTKSLVLAVQSNGDEELLNIAIRPLDANLLGFPIKFIIYRGIKKATLFGNDKFIKASDPSWDSNNILDIIKKLQDKINLDNETSNLASASSLGYDFSEAIDSTYLEKIFFDNSDNFHPIIVPAGCQIGKFYGGASHLASVQIILDRIGYETQLDILKKSEHIFQIPKLILVENLPTKEKLIKMFNTRMEKEEILNYLDITAFYGASKNQNKIIKKTVNGNDFLSKFYNKNVVYIDVRNDQGFSYNHFFKLEDTVELGFYSTNTSIKKPIFEPHNYYSKWPILILKNIQYNTDRDNLFIMLPILAGNPENLNFISSYVGKIFTGSGNKEMRHTPIALSDNSINIQLKRTEPIGLKNWRFNDNKLGANYFLLKKSAIGDSLNQQYESPIWNNFFSLKMNNIFGNENIEDGHFRVYTYSSLNSPLIVNAERGEAYYPTSGIAVDKDNVTFFSYKSDLVYQKVEDKAYYPKEIIATGKFQNKSINTSIGVVEDLELNSQADSTAGYLNQILNTSNKIENFELAKFSFNNTEDSNSLIKFLFYTRIGEYKTRDDVFETFEAITLTHKEYKALKDLETTAYTDNEFFVKHPSYIKSNNLVSIPAFKFVIKEYTLSLGVATIVEGNNNMLTIDLIDYPEEILVNDEKISLITAILY
ncbi:hypothetical protein [Flavobacterium sp. '19STA2R22 D10 B1']|uniref:hypothetical protein n=1 Tax=Flavobacterium aerium TaxID=3037261 RepID=UPI00278BDE6C|nr:hypothetical protein [Flavobacterium sp. '19STA2R22 D10 B1']